MITDERVKEVLQHNFLNIVSVLYNAIILP